MPGLCDKVGLALDVLHQQCSSLDGTEAHQQSDLVSVLYSGNCLPPMQCSWSSARATTLSLLHALSLSSLSPLKPLSLSGLSPLRDRMAASAEAFVGPGSFGWHSHMCMHDYDMAKYAAEICVLSK